MKISGNIILLADSDKAYAQDTTSALTELGCVCHYAQDLLQAKSLLKTQDFDLVICNYYLSDGVIHQLIEWSVENLKVLPIFTCVGYALPGDIEISQRYAISDTFTKSDPTRMFSGIARLLFDFNQFYNSLLEMIAPTEIILEIQVGGEIHFVKPIEVSMQKVFFQSENPFDHGAFGFLRFYIKLGEDFHNFNIPGFITQEGLEEFNFQIHPSYLVNWDRFLGYLEVKQIDITDFLARATGRTVNG
jgi:CheY-like chemotaxis protein